MTLEEARAIAANPPSCGSSQKQWEEWQAAEAILNGSHKAETEPEPETAEFGGDVFPSPADLQEAFEKAMGRNAQFERDMAKESAR